ncbi:hypothetical protein E5D08_28360 [Klebsiella pneumoniae]|uniref:hypothetical protein n=1 Tax=Klebsiella TaxID=570 RepID=UPI0021C0511D|nr:MULTISPECIES: hypothetical protein [Klebsiella]EJA9211460.1 hypothetical protein [Escherichia coli]HBY1220035.1 hypothetical protein [Klebsiella aerogenes]EIW9594134.1 hypothetical protein [Klebsiella pneumoniae]MCT8891947.1 hypothetical protein [Klebsiella quasipneumoniae subsp. similipneumoniae]MDP0618029.1 hypothetical protein [Klebsiella pneumoniae]
MQQLNHKNYPYIQIALSSEDFDAFTVKSLRLRLAKQGAEGQRCSDDLKALYRTLVAMVKKGELYKKVADNPRNSTFHKTAKFPYLNSMSSVCSANSSLNMTTNISQELADTGTIQYLENQLKEYQVSLLISIGECDEYKSILKSLPELQPKLDNIYMASRERCSTLLGKISAINNVLLNIRGTI